MINKFILYSIYFLMFNINIIYGCNFFNKNDEIIAIVDKKIILKSDIDFALKIGKLEKIFFNKNIKNNNLKKIILDQLISDYIIYKIFDINKINIDNYKIDNYIKNISNNILLSKKEFTEYILSNNIDIDDYKKFIKKKIIIKEIIKKNIKPFILNSKEELDKISKKDKDLLINNLLVKYDLSIIKIDNKNLYKNNIDIIKSKLVSLFSNKNKINFLKNINIFNKFFLNKIVIKHINKLYKDLPELIIYNLYKNNNSNFIGPIYVYKFIYFIKINSISNVNVNDNLKEVDIFRIYSNKNNYINLNNNFNIINDIYIKIIKNNNILNINEYNINNIYLKKIKYKNINYYNNHFKKIINDIYISKISKPFIYKNRWNLIYINKYIDILYINYINNIWINKFMLKNKSIYILNELINNIKDKIYIKILNKSYFLE